MTGFVVLCVVLAALLATTIIKDRRQAMTDTTPQDASYVEPTPQDAPGPDTYEDVGPDTPYVEPDPA